MGLAESKWDPKVLYRVPKLFCYKVSKSTKMGSRMVEFQGKMLPAGIQQEWARRDENGHATRGVPI